MPGLPQRRHAQCLKREGIGLTRDGGFQAEVRVPSRCCVAIPPNLDSELAALAEPLGVGMEAVLTGEVGLGDTVLVLGPGTIGQAIALSARLAGAARVIVAGRADAPRFEVLRALGFSDIVDVAEGSLQEQVLALTGGRAVDVVLEATGVPSTLNEGMAVLKKGRHRRRRHPCRGADPAADRFRPHAPPAPRHPWRGTPHLGPGDGASLPRAGELPADGHPPAAAGTRAGRLRTGAAARRRQGDPDAMSNSERVALVTGAARGIGAGIAAKLASLGHPVIVADVIEERKRPPPPSAPPAAGPAPSPSMSPLTRRWQHCRRCSATGGTGSASS
ncbi:zinc-binding dehydrogenase [Siccirubricoccus deserti]